MKTTSAKTSSVAKTTGLVSLFTFLSRIFGMIRDSAIAAFFGAGIFTDSFYLAFTIPNLLRRFVAEGTLTPAFIPVFTDELKKSEDNAKQTIKATTSLSLILTITLSALGILYAHELTDFFAPGFRNNPEQFELTVNLTRLMLPYIIAISLLAFSGGAQNALGYFALAAGTQVIMNFIIIIGVPTSWFISKESLLNTKPIYVLAIFVTLSSFIALIPNISLLKKLGFPLGFSNPFKSDAVKKIFYLMIPAILAASVYQLMVLFNRMLASMLEQGSITWYYYSDRLVQFPLGVFSVALATAILPKLSKLSTNNNNQEFDKELSIGLSWISYVTIPATFGLSLLSKPIVNSVYGYGLFSDNDSIQTSSCLIAFSVGLWAISAHSLIVRAYFAKKNTFLPSIISICVLITNTTLAIAFMGKPKNISNNSLSSFISFAQKKIEILDLAHVGLALAGSIGSLIGFISLAFLLRTINVRVYWAEFIKNSALSLIAALVMALFLYYTRGISVTPIIKLILLIPSSALIYQASTTLLKSKLAKQSNEFIKSKLYK